MSSLITAAVSAGPTLMDAFSSLSLSGLGAILVMILGLSLLIAVHELGHWFVARLFGFQTPVFSIGFGKREHSLVLGTFWETEFRLAPILLGGYVSIPELQDETTAQEMLKGESKPFRVFPVWQRICVAAAGVVFNIISAALILFALFTFIGQPSLNVKDTYIKDLSTQITVARDAGLKANDHFVSVAGASVKTPEDVQKALAAHKGESVPVVVERDNGTASAGSGQGKTQVTIQLTPDKDGHIGVSLVADGERVFNAVPLGKAAGDAVDITGKAIWGTVKGFGMLLHIVDRPAGVSDKDMQVHGVIGIVQMGAGALGSGIFDFGWFLVMISINLAVLNILPLPILDGGHIVFLLIEKIRGGKPVDAQLRARLYNIFGMLLLALFLLGLFNDLTSLLGL